MVYQSMCNCGCNYDMINPCSHTRAYLQDRTIKSSSLHTRSRKRSRSPFRRLVLYVRDCFHSNIH